MILEAWWSFERSCTTETIEKTYQRAEDLAKKMPRKVKRKRILYSGLGKEIGLEEYWDYVFPEEESATTGIKLLEAAYRWKKSKIINES